MSMDEYIDLQEIIPFEEIQSATNNFADENLIAQGSCFTVYKGQLLLSGDLIDIVARKSLQRNLVINELTISKNLKHKNIVSVFKISRTEDDEVVIINKHEANGSLEKHLSDPNFTWIQRLNICVGVANALRYLHNEARDDYNIIHANIKSSKVLLDQDWDPKLHGFAFALTTEKNRVHHTSNYNRSLQYMDPEYENTGGLTHKSDVFSFGVLLFEVLFGRQAFVQNNDNWYFSRLARAHYEEGKLDDLIDPNLLKQMNLQSLNVFAETAYYCLNEKRSQRPNMNRVLSKLEEALSLQFDYHEHPVTTAEATLSSNHQLKIKSLDHLKIPLRDIELATNGFSETCCIGSGAYGKVYKARLEVLDDTNLVVTEEKNKGELPKKLSTVAVKRFFDKYDEHYQASFFGEIVALSSYKHPNIVSFCGFCDEADEMILIYEYISNGSLADYLENIDNMHNLTWAQRIRLCLNIAHGLEYLHSSTEDGPLIHCDIKSDNILLDNNWMGKIADFGLTNLHSADQLGSTVITNHIAGTNIYLDPEYLNTGKLKTKSDVYSFGVVMFEIMCGKLAYDKTYGHKGLASIARKCFKKGTLHSLVDPRLTQRGNFMLNEGVDQDSLDTFIKIAYQCVAKAQDKRPTMNDVIKELMKSLEFQKNNSLNAYQLTEILSATNYFSDENLITKGGLGNVYRGRLISYGEMDILVRRLDCKYGQGDELETEISMLSSLVHKNIISVAGYCNEDGEKIVIYKQAYHGNLYQYLSDPTIMTWARRLQICLGVSRALSCIHYDVIHCNINSAKILLDGDWEPKIFGFELSTKYPQSWRHRLLFSSYLQNKYMTPKHDIYSFGVLLFEVLYGMKPKKAEDGVKVELDGIINPDLKKQMDAESLDEITKITSYCLNENPLQRPRMDQIVKQLEHALELQLKHENNLEHSTAAHKDEGTSSSLKTEWLKIPLSDIKEATNGFDEAHWVGSGGYGIVYKAELDVLDIQNLLSVEGKRKRKDELPKRRRTVAIKYIIDRQGEEGKQGFLAEIDLLTSCNHPNVISLLGFSSEARNMILVYEYAIKGSLSDYLGNTSNTINLTWAKRLQICLDIAHGISYLHMNVKGKPMIIHRDIKSDNILLDENLNAKVADFGLSKFHLTNQQASSVYTKHIAGTPCYVDPEYLTSGKYKKESDIYSFGVVMFEILSGRMAHDSIYTDENNAKELALVARHRFNEGTLKELIDPRIIEEDDEHLVTLNRGPNQKSFDAFSTIACQCLAETQAKRPRIETIIKELQNALNLQGETMILTRFRLSEILSATENFSEILCIGLDEYTMVYKAEVDDFANKSSLAFKEKNDKERPKTRVSAAIKHISSTEQAKQKFFSEIERCSRYKHSNIVSLLGFCDEDDQMILVYEHAANNSLDDYLKNADNMGNFTWMQRLRMSLEIAHGLDHLHTKINSQHGVIHGDLRSANILVAKNLEPKIAYYGISEFRLANEEASAKVYWSPEFQETRIMKTESDIYSLGVILFEIFCGKLAYDHSYIADNEKGLAPIARGYFNDGSIRNLIDPKLKEASDDDIFTSNKGINQDSLDAFLKIAYQCLGEAKARPTTEIIIKELETALNFQENLMKRLHISHKDIEVATQKFSKKNWLGSGRYWEAYTGEILLDNVYTTIVAKRWDCKFEAQFLTELDILFKCKHTNIIGLVGYCNEMNEKIIVYEHLSKGSLDRYLKDSNLTWMKRLEICIDVANALKFLHGGDVTLKNQVVHRDIKTHNIFLDGDWNAKISNFEMSALDSLHQDMKHIIDDAYLDPQYKQGVLTEKSDIYSFGVVLFEVLCGKLAWVEGHESESQSLGPLAKHYYEQEKVEEMVFEDIKKQIMPLSLRTFANIAYRCLHEDGEKRPEASEVAIQLKKALEVQEDFEIWDPKLPKDYKKILQLLENPDLYHTQKKRDIYQMLFKGTLLQKKKMWYMLSHNGKAIKMMSATTFSYKNHESHRWRHIQSRFPKVAKMLDVSNLKIEITINNKYLTPDVTYSVYLVFRFCDPRFLSYKSMYMNLKYRNGSETLNSYFATWRDDKWMMIELYRFLNRKQDVSFSFLLESFSRYYCPSGAIYIEGIEFQTTTKVAHEDNNNLKEQVQKLNPNLDHLQYQLPTFNEEKFKRSDRNEKLFLSELNGKKQLLLSAKEVLFNSPKWGPFRFVSSEDSRFQDVAELLPRQVFRIKYKIKAHMLSPSTEYVCYLLFKISEKCQGLHCPVKVQDLLQRKKKERNVIYFRSPAPLNKKDAFRVPEKGKDGWMYVMISKLNNDKHGKKDIPINLKLVTYEGTMSGLIISGLEFRPI